MKKVKTTLVVGAVTLALSATVALVTPRPASGFIHEMIAAACRAGGEEVIPPGQAGESSGSSFVRALQATGVISSIVATPTSVTVNFDLSQPNAKFMSAGFAFTIPNGAGPGVDLILNPLPVLDPTFAAHANCNNLN